MDMNVLVILRLLMLACFVQSKTSFDVCLGSLSCWSAHFFSHLAVVGGSLIHSQRMRLPPQCFADGTVFLGLKA